MASIEKLFVEGDLESAKTQLLKLATMTFAAGVLQGFKTVTSPEFKDSETLPFNVRSWNPVKADELIKEIWECEYGC